jgi:methylenetetrahydrofolate--tRNA-(uracil-5-)-methyltransferase
LDAQVIPSVLSSKKKVIVKNKVTIIGGGLAGVEAAYQLSKRGVVVDLYEMRPHKMTEAHETGFLGEMVCSNSLGATEISSSSGLLKAELKRLDSFFLSTAQKKRVPAGSSFSVDRLVLAEDITAEIRTIKNINLIREEVKDIMGIEGMVIIATGPLTSLDFSNSLSALTMRKNLFFYDATSPIIRADSIDFSKVYRASRYNKGSADFINIPLNETQYNDFVEKLVESEKVELKDFEKNIFFEYCLPIEEIARRGQKSLAFGTLKPVGLENPLTNTMPYAVVQLRLDDIKHNFYQMVGFQTRMKQREQKRIFKELPGLEKARFERFGRMHRNTYINAPLLIDEFYQFKAKENLFFAGQICGVEGYVESISSGLIAGIYAAKKVKGEPLIRMPLSTACGSLINYITHSNWKNFKPTKFTYGLLPELPVDNSSFQKLRNRKGEKKKKKELKALIALENLEKWMKSANI